MNQLKFTEHADGILNQIYLENTSKNDHGGGNTQKRWWFTAGDLSLCFVVRMKSLHSFCPKYVDIMLST